MPVRLRFITPSVGGGGGGLYSTTFPATENPISQGGIWVNGGDTGGSWHNVQTVPGNAHAADFVAESGLERYSDALSILSTSLTFNANQYAEGHVYRVPGYAPSVGHEIELLLRFSISSGDAHGYEVLWGRAGGMAIVRWNGSLGGYTPSSVDGQDIGIAATDDVLRAEIIGNILSVYKNTVLQASINITTDFAGGGSVWSTGQPGIGFWPVPNGSPAPVVLSSYGWKYFEAGNI